MIQKLTMTLIFFPNTYFWLRNISCLYSKLKILILIDVLDTMKNLNTILVDPNADQGSNYNSIYISLSGQHISIKVQTINFEFNLIFQTYSKISMLSWLIPMLDQRSNHGSIFIFLHGEQFLTSVPTLNFEF